MKLTDERLDEITSKIFERAGKFRCPICGSSEGFTFPEAVPNSTKIRK